jgi:threonine dehydrogenase-like Zn-dependent dehydrogenase
MSDYEGILGAIERGLDPSRLITHRFELENAADAYAAFDRGNTGKVTFVPEI